MHGNVLRYRAAWVALGLSFWIGSAAFSQTAEDLFDFEHGLKFARFLEQQQRWDLAIAEYRRLDAETPDRLEVRMALLQLYALDGKPSDGIATYEGWHYQPQLAPTELRRKYIGLFFQNRDFASLASKLQSGIGLKEPDKTRVQLQLALYNRDWPQAQRLFEAFEIQHVHKNRQTYAPILKALDDLHYREPWLGAALSIVPGAGQAYAGQWIDGLSSLFLVGVTGFEAYRLLHKRGPKNLLAWGLAGMSLSFYVANIYGGRRAVARYNERRDAEIQQILDGVSARDF
jgi:hypothetical protein